MRRHALTIGIRGRIRAHVFAESVVIPGEVIGNTEATDKVAISAEGTVEGDIRATRYCGSSRFTITYRATPIIRSSTAMIM